MLFLTALFASSCVKDKMLPAPKPVVKTYLHIAHTRANNNYEIDETAARINYSMFDMVWLGGDLEYLTSKNDSSVAYINSIFDVESPNTLWSLGNHDYTNIDLISKYTNRPSFYTFNTNGITFVVLDTQYDKSKISGLQLEMFNKVTDTIEKSSHLIVLLHKLIWMYGNDSLQPIISDISNGQLGDCFYCINPNNFYEDLYPELLKVKQRGIEVLCISGDIGLKINKFEYVSPEGIFFMASGIKEGRDDNMALLFKHNVTYRQLTWKYVLISDLANMF